jgi:hypothetical protein
MRKREYAKSAFIGFAAAISLENGFDLDFGPFEGFPALVITAAYMGLFVLIDALRGFPEPQPSQPRRKRSDGDPAQVTANLQAATLQARRDAMAKDPLSWMPSDLAGTRGRAGQAD